MRRTWNRDTPTKSWPSSFTIWPPWCARQTSHARRNRTNLRPGLRGMSWTDRVTPVESVKIYLHFVWFLKTEPVETDKILFHSHRRQGPLFALYTLIASFMGPTWGPSGADRTHVGPILAPLTLLYGYVWRYFFLIIGFVQYLLVLIYYDYPRYINPMFKTNGCPITPGDQKLGWTS